MSGWFSWTSPAGGGGAAATWGSITGTLSNQTDLQTALTARPTGTGADTYVALWSGTNTVTGHNAFTFDRSLTAFGIGGTPSADIKVFMWGNVNLSNAAQFGYYSRPQFQSSATSSGTVYIGELYAASGFSMTLGTIFETGTNNVGTTTVTRFRSFSAKPQTTGGTGNVCFTDGDSAFSGNWFIYGGSALASHFSKYLEIAADEDPGAPTDAIRISSKVSTDSGTPNTLHFRTEQAVEAIGTFTPANKIRVWVNNIEYWIQLDPV